MEQKIAFDIIPWDGKLIKKPGIYSGLSLDIYHSNCCDGPSISSSGLRTIEQKSPRHYWFDSPLNPRRSIAAKQKSHLNLGSAAHTLFMGDSDFKKRYAIRPDAWDNWRSNAAKAWRDQQVQKGLMVLEPKHIDMLRGMAEALRDDPIIKSGILVGHYELSMFWKDEETGVWLKARPDILSTAEAAIIDLKTCEKGDAVSCARAVTNNGYHMQLALAGTGFRILTGTRIREDGYILVFVESDEPYGVNVKPIRGDDIDYGRALNRQAIRKFAKCWEAKDWPTYEDSGVVGGLTSYERSRLFELRKVGALPTED